LSRTEFQCNFLEYRGLKVIYRRYASLFFVVAVDGDDENELSLLGRVGWMILIDV
jgi:AP-4 complex subunit sigma-1